VLFADDTTVLLSDPDANKLTELMTLELIKLQNWIKCNKLKINGDKTYFILFGPRIRTNLINNEILLNNSPIQRVYSIKFLGIIISSNLSWRDHILFISKKMSRNIGIIYKLKNNFPNYILCQLYYSLVYPYLIYCTSIWGNCSKSLLHSIRICQNKFIRILFQLKKYDHVHDLYINAEILNIDQIFLSKVMILIYKLWVKKINLYYFNYLNSHLNTQQFNFRHPSIFKIPKFRTKIYSRSTLSISMRLWNHLPNESRCLVSICKFKNNIRNLILTNHFNTIPTSY